ncbi:serine/threonine-protein kinase PknB [Variibacter gotjawalensis]|uniref:Serine/threonine-protein kinase PknB n=1 Tax=Variibacter gotjawalensis TaxID=1333996 RepID=A0A0S3Q026_9BRAD|nr:serine/threonine-protein kinase [Variibacter gotjawalensis]NIK47388.1 tRNA A-37 threonylcarbamoyl transferase component Bud32 [Variibacter gotjawalensis]RZS49284.1 protein kinase-like protein [Variibacter gotjawalensis]BAT61548.1 serine/threonine-protein kinase PknB [Variibacter gotjawalensis]
MTAPPAPDPKDIIESCFTDLAANQPADMILPRLREIETAVEGKPRLKAQLLRARAIATNRLGFGSEALGDLHDARRLLEEADDPEELAKVLLAIATVFIWRGDGREASFALLRAVAEGSFLGSPLTTGLALIEAGRLQIENGRPADAQALLGRALAIGGDALPKREYQRAWVNLLQALVAAGLIEKARALRDSAGRTLEGASSRLLMLERLESARIDRAAGELATARAAIDAAIAYAPADKESFEAVEIAHVEAEQALAEGDAERAAGVLQNVIARYAADDLATREVQVRLLHAQALEALKQGDEAERTLGAALRRAVARGLNGYADQVRSRMSSRGGEEGAGLSRDVPAEASVDTAARFVRQRPLGAGGFGKVMRAYDLELGIEVAIKRSSLKEIYDPGLRGRLLEAARTEVEAASRLNHPGIARVYGLLAEPGGDSLLIQEFVEGKTLRDAMKGKFDRGRAYDVLSRVSFSLAAVHATGVIHRDLKPDNVIVRPSGAPVLVDFGIALLSKSGDGAAGGTPGYMPPEQARGGTIDVRTDLYALGIMAYEVLTGELPQEGGGFGPDIIASLFRRRTIFRDLLDLGIDSGAATLISQLTALHPRYRPAGAAIAGTAFADAANRASGRAV